MTGFVPRSMVGCKISCTLIILKNILRSWKSTDVLKLSYITYTYSGVAKGGPGFIITINKVSTQTPLILIHCNATVYAYASAWPQ